MPETKKAEIMDASAIDRALTRIAHEIIERNKGVENMALIGIQRRGVPLAEMLAEKIRQVEGTKLPIGTLDITLYRDDLSSLSETPELRGSNLPFELSGKALILCDDVIFTGRTARAAIDAIMDKGRPASIQLMAFIDRGHRELPIRPDYVGKNIPTALSEVIHVNIAGIDGEQNVVITTREE